MPKKILLIENDQGLTDRISESLEASGFDVRVTGDGKDGLEIARDWSPNAVVLCVELPSMSGYLVCQKLKKDDGLKAIPLVLTSAEATEETFEKHRTLKARADEYLLKPYEPQALIEKLGALIGLPEPAALEVAPIEEAEELVTLEEEIGGLEAAEGEPDTEIPGLALESLPADPDAAAEGATSVDEDLKLLDDAFDGLSAAPAPGEAAAALDELTDARRVDGDADASLPDADEGSVQADLGGLDDEAETALGALGEVDETLSPGLSLRRGSGGERAGGADLLRAAGVPLDDEPGAPPPVADLPGGGLTADAERLADELRDVRDALERARGELGARQSELRDLLREVEALTLRADGAEAELTDAKDNARKAEAEAQAGRDEVRRAAEQARTAEAEVADLRAKVAEADRRAGEAEKRAAAAEEDARRKAQEAAAAANATARAEALEREADELRTELLVARGEADGARAEIERRTDDLRKRVAELEATNSKNEERVVKAYQKIKGDEKVRDKVRKALAIATQLLEEGLPTESAAEKERRAASGGGRE